MADRGARVGPVALTASSVAETVTLDDASTYTTVPAGKCLWIKGVRGASTSTGDRKVTWGIGVDATGTRLSSEFVVPANGKADDAFEGPGVPIFAGESFRANADASGVTLTAWGVQVDVA